MSATASTFDTRGLPATAEFFVTVVWTAVYDKNSAVVAAVVAAIVTVAPISCYNADYSAWL